MIKSRFTKAEAISYFKSGKFNAIINDLDYIEAHKKIGIDRTVFPVDIIKIVDLTDDHCIRFFTRKKWIGSLVVKGYGHTIVNNENLTDWIPKLINSGVKEIQLIIPVFDVTGQFLNEIMDNMLYPFPPLQRRIQLMEYNYYDEYDDSNLQPIPMLIGVDKPFNKEVIVSESRKEIFTRYGFNIISSYKFRKYLLRISDVLMNDGSIEFMMYVMVKLGIANGSNISMTPTIRIRNGRFDNSYLIDVRDKIGFKYRNKTVELTKELIKKHKLNKEVRRYKSITFNKAGHIVETKYSKREENDLVTVVNPKPYTIKLIREGKTKEEELIEKYGLKKVIVDKVADSVRKFKDWIMDWIYDYVVKQDSFGSEEFDVIGMDVFFTKLAGGCYGKYSFGKLKKKVIPVKESGKFKCFHDCMAKLGYEVLSGDYPVNLECAIVFVKECQEELWEFNGKNFELLSGIEYEETKNVIVYWNEHYYLMDKSAVYYERCSECFGFYKNIRRHKCNVPKSGILKYSKIDKIEKDTRKIFVADIETYTINGVHHEYGFGWCEVIRNGKKCSLGDVYIEKYKGCLVRGIEKIFERLGNDKEGLLYFYNGARFDTVILMKRMLQTNGYDFVKILNSNNSFITYTLVRESDGKILVMRDLMKFTLCSLKAACKSFNVKHKKIDGFDHNRINSIDDAKEIEAEWVKYLEYDVKGTAEVLCKFMEKIGGFTNYISIGHMAESIFRLNYLNCEVKLPSKDEYNRMRGALYGGRTVCIVRRNKGERLFLLDVVSLYPAAMYYYSYPVCKKIEFSDDNDVIEKELKRIDDMSKKIKNWVKNSNYIGDIDFDWFAVVKCDVECNKKLKIAVLPRRLDNGEIEWDLEDKIGCTYTNIELAIAVSMGYKIKKVYEVGIFKGTKCSKVFRKYIEKYFEEKRKIDKKKDPVGYTIAKLMLNSLYGKMIQKPNSEKTAIVNDLEEYFKVLKGRSVNREAEIGWYDDDMDERMIISFDDKLKVRKPYYWGLLVLSYSRLIMHWYFSKCGAYNEFTCYYTDTDSLLVNEKGMERLVEYINKDELGSLSMDIEGEIIDYVGVNRKLYAMKYIDADGEEKWKFKMRGVNLNKWQENLIKMKKIVDEEEKMRLNKKLMKKLMKKYIKLLNGEEIEFDNELIRRTIFGIGGYKSLEVYNTKGEKVISCGDIGRIVSGRYTYPVGYNDE